MTNDNKPLFASDFRSNGSDEEVIQIRQPATMRNPRLVLNNPDMFFGRDLDLYEDLMLEQQEQM